MTRLGTSDVRLHGLYKFGGVAALFIAVLLIGEVIVYAVLASPGSVAGTFELFHRNSLAGLLSFDLLGMLAYLLFIPMTLALYFALRRTDETLATVGTVLFFVGISVFFASNTAFSLLSLSNQYAAAKSDAERTILLAAGQAMITLFKVNAFLVSYVIVSVAWAIISWAMLRSRHFGWTTSWTGILAGASGIVAEILENTSRSFLPVAIFFYFSAVVLLLIWVILSGQRLFKMSVAPQDDGSETAMAGKNMLKPGTPAGRQIPKK